MTIWSLEQNKKETKKYRETFEKLAKNNRFGDAIRSALSEGKMAVIEARNGNTLVGTFNETEFRAGLAKEALIEATEKRKKARIELDKMIDDIAKGITVDSDLQDIIRMRVESTVNKERELASVAGVKINPFLK